MKAKKLQNDYIESNTELPKPEIFSLMRTTNPNNHIIERNFDENIDYFTQRIEEMSFQFESEKAKKEYFDKKLELLNRKNNEDQQNKEKKSTSMDFQKAVVKRLLKNTEEENRNMIDAMLEGRIASINIPSNFRNNFHSVDKLNKTKTVLPFELNTGAIRHYKKKEDQLRKQLMLFKENQIFKFRVKYKKKQQNAKQEEKIIENKNSLNSSLSIEELDSKDQITNEKMSNIISSNIRHRRPNTNSTIAEDFINKAKNLKSSSMANITRLKTPISLMDNSNKTGSNLSFSTIKNNLFEKSKFTEDTTRNLQRKMGKTMTKLSKSITSFVRTKKKYRNDADKKLFGIPAHYQKAKGIFLYGDGKLGGKFYDGNEENMKKDTYDIITKLKDENAYKVKEVLVSKFGIKYHPDDLLYRREKKNSLTIEESMNPHNVINNLMYGIAEKKNKLIKKIDEFKSISKTDRLSQKVMPKIIKK